MEGRGRMQLKIDDIEKNDDKVRQIFPTAQMIKMSRSKVIWTNNGTRIAEMELVNDRNILFKFGKEDRKK